MDKYKRVPITGTLLYLRNENGIDMMTIRKGGRNMKKILLCCGSGASSGFMAKNANTAAKARKLDYSIKARSESEVEDYLDDLDLVMVGPHFKHRYEAIKEIASEYDVPVVLIDGTIYGALNGEGLVDQIIEVLK